MGKKSLSYGSTGGKQKQLMSHLASTEKMLSFVFVGVKKLMVKSTFHFEECGCHSSDLNNKWQSVYEKQFTISNK